MTGGKYCANEWRAWLSFWRLEKYWRILQYCFLELNQFRKRQKSDVDKSEKRRQRSERGKSSNIEVLVQRNQSWALEGNVITWIEKDCWMLIFLWFLTLVTGANVNKPITKATNQRESSRGGHFAIIAIFSLLACFKVDCFNTSLFDVCKVLSLKVK